LGVFYGTEEILKNPKFCEKYKLTPGIKGKTTIVQGLGNVGYWAAHFFEKGGAKIIGLVEYNSSVYNPDGLDVDDVTNYFRANKSLKGYPKAKEVYDQANCYETMYKEVDILVPAAIENSITKFNCEKIKAKLIAEGANGPTTFAAQQHLDSRHIPVLPDFVMNAGGVTVSYFEWLKNLEHSRLGRLTKGWERKTNEVVMKVLGIDIPEGTGLKEGPSEKQIVYSALQAAMSSAVTEVFNKSLEMDCSIRVAGFVLTIQKIAAAYEDAGIF